MAKNTRGRNIKKNTDWRGTCPICKRTGVKLMWTGENDQKICKVCSKAK